MPVDNIKCGKCGCKEFITQPDSYSVYEAVGNKLRFISAESTMGKDKLLCRDCGTELDTEGIKFI